MNRLNLGGGGLFIIIEFVYKILCKNMYCTRYSKRQIILNKNDVFSVLNDCLILIPLLYNYFFAISLYYVAFLKRKLAVLE